MTNTLPKAYIASPCGFDQPEMYWYNQVFIPWVSKFVDPQDPWAKWGPEGRKAGVLPGDEPEWHKAGYHDEILIRGSEYVIALLQGPVIDSGTASEMGFGYGVGKKVFGLRLDFRSVEDMDAPINLQTYYWIQASGGGYADSLDQLEILLRTASA